MSDLAEETTDNVVELVPAPEEVITTKILSAQALRGIEYAQMGSTMSFVWVAWLGAEEPALLGRFIVVRFRAIGKYVMFAGRFKSHDDLWKASDTKGGEIVAAGRFNEKADIDNKWMYDGDRFKFEKGGVLDTFMTDSSAMPTIQAFLNRDAYYEIRRYW